MLDFLVNPEKCTRCSLCVGDCPAKIIAMPEGSFPSIAPEQEAGCYRCQHCMAICPTAAVSILGLQPENSIPLPGPYPTPDQLELLIKGRRSVRRY